MKKRRFTGRLGKTSNHTIRKAWGGLKSSLTLLPIRWGDWVREQTSIFNIMKASASDVGVVVRILFVQGMLTNGEPKMLPY